MDDDFEIPTNPHSAAAWLIVQTNAVFEENECDSSKANLFFGVTYETVKQSLRNDDEQMLFVLALSEDLEAAQPKWFTDEKPTS